MAEAPIVHQKDIEALLVAVKDYLVAQSIGTFATDLFIQQLPEDVAPLGIVIVSTGGPILPDDPTRRPTFQIQVRSELSRDGLRKAVQINRLLDNQWNVLTGFPGRLVAVSEAGLVFKDDSGNSIYPLNYALVTTTQA